MTVCFVVSAQAWLAAVCTGCYHLLLISRLVPKTSLRESVCLWRQPLVQLVHDTDYVLFGAPRSVSRLNQTNAWEQAQVQVLPQTDWRRGHRGTVWSAMSTNHGELFCIRFLLGQCSVLFTLGFVSKLFAQLRRKKLCQNLRAILPSPCPLPGRERGFETEPSASTHPNLWVGCHA